MTNNTNNTNSTNVPTDLADYFDRTFWPRRLGGSARTQRLYRLVLTRFGEFLQRRPTRDDLNDDVLCAFLQSRLVNRAAHTVDKERDKLVSLANFAAKKRHIEQFPDVPAIPLPKKQPQAMTLEQVESLLAACRALPGRVGQAPACDWWYAYHLVALTTGERTGAMHCLEWSWLRPTGWLPVPGEVRKAGKPETHFLPPAVMDVVERLRGKTFVRIFDMPFTASTFWNRNKAVLAAAGLPTTRQWQPQMNRRTFASWYAAKGGNAMEALGHTDGRVTKESYLDPTIATRDPASKLVAQALGFI